MGNPAGERKKKREKRRKRLEERIYGSRTTVRPGDAGKPNEAAK